MIDRNLNYGRDIIEKYFINSKPYSVVMDIGAGSGTDLLLARKVNPTAELHAIEVFPESVSVLTKRGIKVMPIDLERDSIPLKNESVDIVVSNQVLEHVKELFWISHEVCRVLKVEGTFVVGVPNLAALHNRLLLGLGFQPTPIKNWSAHIRGYTKRDLLEFFELCWPGGVELLEFKGSNFYPFPPFLARPLSRIFPNLSWGIFLRFKKIKNYNNEFLNYLDKAKLETNFYRGPNK